MKFGNNRIDRLFFLLPFILLWSCHQSNNDPVLNKNAPNIILIMADDLGFETIGANGGTSYKTPFLDKMAQEGIRFTHCYSQPLCTPSRVKTPLRGIFPRGRGALNAPLQQPARPLAVSERRRGAARFATVL